MTRNLVVSFSLDLPTRGFGDVMRIAISGSHRTGKSTLIAALAESLSKYTTVDEPYHLMEEDGYEFSHPPSVEGDTESRVRKVLEHIRLRSAELPD
jgi:AAA domain